MLQNITVRLEQTQHSAALGVARALRGTNRQKLYKELGWESLYNQSWCRRLVHFFNLRRTGTSDCLYAEVATGRTGKYGLRNKREYDVPYSKTKRSSNTCFTNALHERNLVESTVKNSATFAKFKCKLINFMQNTSIRAVKNSLFGVFYICDAKKLTMLQTQF